MTWHIEYGPQGDGWQASVGPGTLGSSGPAKIINKDTSLNLHNNKVKK